MPVETTALRGHSIIAGVDVVGTGGSACGHNPATDQPLQPEYSLLETDQLHAATAAAEQAYPVFSTLAPETHARFLERIAANIQAAGPDLVQRAMAETGLPEARLTGELGRTTGQLRLFAQLVRKGDFRGVRVDPALPDRTPLPRVDIRQRKIPLGPVAVFGASNFPLAFSTAGGDTASALAAGCPVVFKAHNAHPGTSEIVGRAVAAAVAESGLPAGVFSLVYGSGARIGQALAADPLIKAVGFTGSRAAGTALMRTAATRPEPIPVYAEMSSINPVFILEGAISGEVSQLAAAYAASVTGSSGQLCTAPGVVFVPAGAAGDRFIAAVAEAISATSGQTMLTQGIANSWTAGAAAIAEQEHVDVVASGAPGTTRNSPAPSVLATSAEAFLANPALHEEVFGALSLVVRYGDVDQLPAAAAALEGQLTATLHLTGDDHPVAASLLPVLERKAGRILVNGWPTGVEVGHAMVHGGPFPATSDTRTTSVGTLAIERFLRPVAYQNLPDELLPEPLRRGNPWGLARLVDGEAERNC